MAKLDRKTQKIFAQDADSTQVTAFRTAGTTPTYSKDVDDIQNVKFTTGWLDEDNVGNVIPYAEDMNGVFYAFTRNLAYLYQQGIPEWSNSETYYENAMCMYDGVLYQSLSDNNTNQQPDTQTSYWAPYASPVSGSVTGGSNTGTGEGVYTSTSGGVMSFKSLAGGDYISITPSQSGDSLVISYTGSGGGGTTIAWGDITGSLANQSDLATALGARGTLSGNNTWTGSNDFGDILPRTNNTYSLGSSSYAWLQTYTNYLISTSNDHLVIANTHNHNSLLVGEQSSALLDSWGLYPSMDTGMHSYLGSSVYRWDYAYIYNIYSNDIAPIATSGNLGSENNYWSNVYLERIRGGSGTNNIVCYKNFIPSSTTPTETLGNTTYSWASTYTSAVGSNSNTLTVFGSGNASATDFYLKPQNNATNRYLGGSSTNDHWTVGYIDKIYLGAGNGKGLYLSADDSHTYIKDITANTMQLHATASIQFQTTVSGTITGMCQVNNTEFRPFSNNQYNLGENSHRWGTIYYNTMVPPSDIRYKDNIENLESGLKTINDMTIKAYTYKHNRDHIEYGIIAQDIADKYPELVSVPTTEEEPYGIYLHNFLFVALRAIQELSKEVDDLQDKLNNIGVK